MSERNERGQFVKQNLEQRFWSKVDKSVGQGPKGECWEWTDWRFKDEQGRERYGGIKIDDKARYAHRLAYELQSGPIPCDKQVLHTCDNPPCVRGEHLFIGTCNDNVADRNAKGRQARGTKISANRRCFAGENGPNAKFSRQKVTAIRKEYRRGGCTYVQLACKYGVHKSTIYDIIKRRTWQDDSKCAMNI